MGNLYRFYADIESIDKEVTGSLKYCTIHFPNGKIKKLILDCGLFQEREYAMLNNTFPFDPSTIDHVIITHNHVDHTGRLPLLVKLGYCNKIHMSHDTSVLLPNALADTRKLLKRRAESSNNLPLFEDEDVQNTLSLIETHEYEESTWLDENIKLTFFMNGHLPGAVIALVQIYYYDNTEKTYPSIKPINLLFTGDYNNKNMFFDVKPIPSWVHQLPITIIQEATYGNMETTDVERVFEDNILGAISKGCECVIPVFSLGRSQEIMYILSNWQKEGKLSTNIPIHFDGKLGIRYTDLYRTGAISIKPECSHFLPENFTYITGCEEREAVTNDRRCKIILTTSGNGSYGPAQTHLPIYLARQKALIHFTGYVTEGTLGRRLFESQAESIVDLFGLQVKKRATVCFTSEFSAHAKADELIKFLQDFENLNLVLINHSNNATKDIYANRVINDVEPKNVGILGRGYAFRVGPYGLIKSFSTEIS